MTSKNTKKVLEKLIQKSILEWFSLHPNFLVWRNYVGPVVHGGGKSSRHFGKNPMAGMPDIMGFTADNRPFAIEVKTETGKLSPLQVEWIAKLRAKGVKCLVARSLEEVIEFFGGKVSSQPLLFKETNN